MVENCMGSMPTTLNLKIKILQLGDGGSMIWANTLEKRNLQLH